MNTTTLLTACACVTVALASSCMAQGDTEVEGFVPVNAGSGGADDASSEATAGKGGAGAASSTGGSGGQTSQGGEAGASQGGASGEAGAGQGGSSEGGAAGEAGSPMQGGAAGASGAAGAGGAAGSAGAGGCVDPGPEPGDEESTAVSVTSITDCDWDGKSITGTLHGAGDDDWYTFHGDDQAGCTVNPNFDIAPASTLIVCAYFVCDSGSTEVTCDSNSQSSLSPAGHSGCCSSGATFSPKLNCTGTMEDSTKVTVRVRSPVNNCLTYKIDYHY